MANARYHVLDERLRERPDWAIGELYIGGVGLARGYWHDAERTAEKFIHHPATQEQLYRSGDLGCMLPEGVIRFCGRADLQVKINGVRIEPGEVEGALRRHPAVASAAVIAREAGDRRRRQLAAYVVCRTGHACEARELQEFLRTQLSAALIPPAITMLDALPMTASGKINRAALPRLAPRATSTAAPPAEAVARVLDVVAGCLGIDTLTPETNLLEFGADSIDAVRIVRRLDEVLGLRPSFARFFCNPTVLDLAQQYAEQQQRTAAAPPRKPAAPVFLDPDERQSFKEERRGLRHFPASVPRRALACAVPAHLAWLGQRRTERAFAPEPVVLEHLATLLLVLSAPREGSSFHFGYGSAGGLYPVQTYLAVKEGRVEGLAAGTYYYDPVEHALVEVTPGALIDARVHDPFINRPVFERAAFSLFLVAQLAAARPIYGERALHYATVEAGLMAELLELAAVAGQIGLCQIGDLDFDRCRAALALDEDHVLVHSLIGGRRPAAVSAPSEEREEGEV
jgi:SagB-type dehydrogenase family enzyme